MIRGWIRWVRGTPPGRALGWEDSPEEEMATHSSVPAWKTPWTEEPGFELWCWRRLLRVPWTARKCNQSILKEISPEYSLDLPRHNSLGIHRPLGKAPHLLSWRAQGLAVKERTWRLTHQRLAAETVVETSLCSCAGARVQASLATLQPASWQVAHVSPETGMLTSVSDLFQRFIGVHPGPGQCWTLEARRWVR